MTEPAFLVPQWPAPNCVKACVSTRIGGVSTERFASFNLATHVGDLPQAVSENRARLRSRLPDAPLWLEQVHGIEVVCADTVAGSPRADAAFSSAPRRVCAVMTADCLPVLFCDRAGTVVAVAHAGWRGLAEGVLEATIAAMPAAPQELLAWLGPAIGPTHFEVGDEVRARFVEADARSAAAFHPAPDAGKWLADIFLLARQRLSRAGVGAVHGGGLCTVSDPERFYSYRRDGTTGRFATFIWLD